MSRDLEVLVGEIVKNQTGYGELVDRLVIKKLYLLDGIESYKNLESHAKQLNTKKLDEINGLIHRLLSLLGINNRAGTLLEALTFYNSRTWGLEDEVRKGSSSCLSDSEMGIRTREIRDLNQKRNAIKTEIDNLITHAQTAEMRRISEFTASASVK